MYTFSSLDCTSQAWIKFQTLPQYIYVEKVYNSLLLIAIRPSDGDVKPGGPLGAFLEEQAMSRHWVSPSPFHHHHHSTQHNYTTKTVTHTVTLTSTSCSTLY